MHHQWLCIISRARLLCAVRVAPIRYKSAHFLSASRKCRPADAKRKGFSEHLRRVDKAFGADARAIEEARL
jgi:hypothetical protein